MTDLTDLRYPEHEKLRAISPHSQKIGEFLDWLGEQGVQLCRQHVHTDDCEVEEYGRTAVVCGLHDGEWMTDHVPIIERLAAFFEINLVALDAEKRFMLELLRNAPGHAAHGVRQET